MEERRVPLTLILGLGGTGQLVAKHVKALLQRELNTPDFSDIPFGTDKGMILKFDPKTSILRI